jgi:outer membrane protein assembly factor BamB
MNGFTRWQRQSVVARLRRATISAAVAFLVSATISTACAADWPEFRGPTGQGEATDSNPPLEWSPTKNVTWRTPLDGMGWSSPIIFGDRIYLTTSTEIDEQGNQVASTMADLPPEVRNGPVAKLEFASAGISLRALAFNLETGEKVWDVEVFRLTRDQVQAAHAKNGFASPTPVTDGEHIYVHFGPHGTASLGLDGKLVWTNRIEYDARHGAGGSPVLVGNSLVFNCDGVENPFVVGLDSRDGHEIWRTPRQPMDYERFAFSTPLAIPSDKTASGIQLVSPGSHMIGSYDPDTGRELWYVYFDKRWSLVPRPVYVNGMVLVCNGGEPPPELIAIRPDGEGNVSDTHVVWRHDKHVPLTSSVVAVGKHIYMVNDAGIAACTEVETGRLVWKKRFGGNFSSSPIYASGRIYFPGESGVTHVIAAEPKFKELAKNDLDEMMLSSFAVDGDALVIRTSKALYRIEDQGN